MTDINSISSQRTVSPNVSAPISDARDRAAELERARRSATATQVENAESAKARRTEQFRESSELISRAIGANTRVEISAGQGSNPFTYRAVDIDSGEIVSEWPAEDFANLLSVLADANGSIVGDSPAGILLDQQA